jgi:hypothetical protein
MRNREKLSVSPWSIQAEGDFSVKVAAIIILVGAIGFARSGSPIRSSLAKTVMLSPAMGA